MPIIITTLHVSYVIVMFEKALPVAFFVTWSVSASHFSQVDAAISAMAAVVVGFLVLC